MRFAALKTRLMQILLVTTALFASAALNAKDWVYTVKPGDTLWDLCLNYTHYKSCWLEVPDYNGVNYPPSLSPGTRIRFPVAWLKAQPVPATLSYVAGQVFISSDTVPEKQAQIGDTLPMGSYVKTSEDSTATLLFADGATLILEPQSHVVLDLLSKHQQTGMVSTRLKLLTGGAKSRVPKHEVRSNFSVSTPSAIAAVRGTDFRVSASADHMTSEVFEGNILVESLPDAQSKQEVAVAENYGLYVEKGQTIGEAVELLPAVTWENDDIDVTLPYTLSWKLLPSATRYKLELLSNEENEQVIVMEHTSSSSVVLPLEHSQCFKARLSAIDERGLQGMPTTRNMCVAEKLAAPQNLQQIKKNLQWEQVNDALSYRIESSVDTEFSNPNLISETESLSYAMSADYKGQYIRVLALDNKGRQGVPSETIEATWTEKWWILVVTVLTVGLAL